MVRHKVKTSSESEPKAAAKPQGGGRSSLLLFCLRGCAVIILLLAGIVGGSMLLFPSGTTVAAPVDSPRGPPDTLFAKTAIPLVRKFIKSRYKDYAKGKVTLRHLKEHIVANTDIGLTYEDLRDDRYSSVIEDEVDAIVARCDGGKKPIACLDTVSADTEL
ncbi:unnamed protein product [Symbiodinium natans]|uniref:Uncharacterized protein n=1 Tax=Symbiodinium natans TaxID=878477 RepID=A0A812SIJ3_9DINO|nr:unnamed protein product [Symbiodinium natans]